ncbi:Rv0361 family membrane protein [Rhodococcus sp. MEB064]|uniref:Rv0361 family membrane protein n=1 Tax=Rhodococcus sp. MEB064 TaxID=1587522 RepID=UPI0005AC7446|nr:hypothetical protein [Rhodococcus sp. MEB064]KIQ18254.1 hypothetical protein RU01_08780 [Rhodococcus sp. MEB064]
MSPDNSRPAAPRRIEPSTAPKKVSTRSGGRRRGPWIAAALVALLAIAGVVAFALTRGGASASGPSDDEKIRTSIDTFTTALRDGDLATLRTATCGPLASFYGGISDADFAATHDAAVAAGTVPVVESVDTVQITEAQPPDQTTAIAQVTARTEGAEPSARTFDLALDGETWKVCA